MHPLGIFSSFRLSLTDFRRDDIVDSFDPLTRGVEREVEAIDDQVFIARIDDVKSLIPRMDSLRKKISYAVRCLNGKHDVLNGFIKQCHNTATKPEAFPADKELVLYLGDVQDHLITTTSNLVHYDGIIRRSLANCLGQLSSSKLRMNYKIYSLVSKLTILATIIAFINLVTWLFGMNVSVPGQDSHGYGWFFGIVGVVCSVMLVGLGVSYKMKIL